MKTILLFLVAVIPAFAQRGDVQMQDWIDHSENARDSVAIVAVGNLNPITTIWIQNTPHLVVSSNRSAAGAGMEFSHFFSHHFGAALSYSQNPSGGKLLWQGQTYTWPLMERNLSLMARERIQLGRVTQFFDEGPGVVITNGKTSGVSADMAVVIGTGIEYPISRWWSVRSGIELFTLKPGCYGDPTCKATRGTDAVISTGIVYEWGRR